MQNYVLARYPNNYSMEDYEQSVKEECLDEGVDFSQTMISDDGFYSFCDYYSESDYEDFTNVLHEELSKTRIKSGFLEIHNGGWRGQHGMTEMFDINYNNVMSKLMGSGESSIEMYKEGHKLSFIRTSHDEPTGASITLHSGRDFDRVTEEVFA